MKVEIFDYTNCYLSELYHKQLVLLNSGEFFCLWIDSRTRFRGWI